MNETYPYRIPIPTQPDAAYGDAQVGEVNVVVRESTTFPGSVSIKSRWLDTAYSPDEVRLLIVALQTMLQAIGEDT